MLGFSRLTGAFSVARKELAVVETRLLDLNGLELFQLILSLYSVSLRFKRRDGSDELTLMVESPFLHCASGQTLEIDPANPKSLGSLNSLVGKQAVDIKVNNQAALTLNFENGDSVYVNPWETHQDWAYESWTTRSNVADWNMDGYSASQPWADPDEAALSKEVREAHRKLMEGQEGGSLLAYERARQRWVAFQALQARAEGPLEGRRLASYASECVQFAKQLLVDYSQEFRSESVDQLRHSIEQVDRLIEDEAAEDRLSPAAGQLIEQLYKIGAQQYVLRQAGA